MRPLLLLLTDGEPKKMRDIYAALAEQFRLTEAEMTELLPSGRQPTYMNRIGWAKTYLVKAGALESTQRGWVKITTRGQQLLKEQSGISARSLMIFPEFQQFQSVNVASSALPSAQAVAAPVTSAPSLLSPEEELSALYLRLQASLKAELLEQVLQLTPAQFERLVVEVLVAMGYGGSVRDAGQALGRSGDNGIDGLIKQDPLGLDRIYLQAKRWQNTVHSPEIRTFAGSLTYHKASKGVFITTSTFSDGAKATAEQIGNIILLDGEQLTELMVNYGVGVLNRATYQIQRIDSEYFEEL